MSDKNLARRASVEIAFNGLDVTKSIQPWLLSLTYTDVEEDESDDLQIELQDRDGSWLQSWLEDAIDLAAGEKLKINAAIVRKNWTGTGKDELLDCGTFEMDHVKASGPPCTVTMKATALPYSATIRQTLKSKGWESYTLKGIATEMATNAGMTCMYESATNPYYSRVEQVKTSDIHFLQTLCKDAGISLKATNGILVLFDQTTYETADAVKKFTWGDGQLRAWQFMTGSAGTQYSSCRVRYTTDSGVLYQATAYVEDYEEDSDTNQQLEVVAKVSSNAEALTLATKRLRLHNKFEKTAHLETPGDPSLVAGLTVELVDCGTWSGKYLVEKATHKVNHNGYYTSVDCRRILDY